MIKMKNFEPEIVILYCQNCVVEGTELADSTRRFSGLMMRLVVMPCSSKVEISHLVKILEQGTDGIQVVRCPDGECHFLNGNIKAKNRVEYVRGLLDEIDFGSERVGIAKGNGFRPEDLFNLAADRAHAVQSLGPNPMKKEKN